MKACENHNDCIVIYVSKYCPICELEENLCDLEEKLANTEYDIRELKRLNAELQASL